MRPLAGFAFLFVLFLSPPALADDDPGHTVNGDALDLFAETSTTLDGESSAAPSARNIANTGANSASNVTWESTSISCSSSVADPMCGAAREQCGLTGSTPTIIKWRQRGANEWSSGTPSCNGDAVAPPNLPEGVTVVRVPPTPSITQIQQAFQELPFCMPKPSLQPKGGKTLINLDTYYAATWPRGGDCLKPGEVSDKVKLLSWTIEFKIEAQDYDYLFGDGNSTGWVNSAGGAYPDGEITHKYTETGPMRVKVDARLTGQYRANGGAWQDLNATADLQDEPSVGYEVVATKTRLAR